MPTIYALKPKFQQILRPLTSWLYRLGISANGVTVFACTASAAYGAWMALLPGSRWPFLALPLFMLVRMALNAIDGMLAREFGQQSRLGAILNETGDVVADTCLFAPFALLAGVNSGIVALVVFLSILTEFIGVLGQVTGGGRRYDGPLGKSDRAFLFGALGLLIGAGAPALSFLNPVLVLAAVLLAWTCINRVRQALRHAPS
ncbi:CDP-alcohol phosphatidyltransferase family protein [Janthinobacterium sp. 17J80-10]|uniref:CDP-alcohol phosphatidyltransferase family protein n=1 Tax=Janthinobacterium sp. 17J80-10 TaxID=2497863 RepID=UPI001005517B|nr:CDP-alcohol phosphatidyltransferase family protein [Janthinobacterium sp. 17J80-10]QAU33178.1 CDP-alcohol phosphatidyltransferase family protein [Janthinobacterium sp. 17J80-10]